MELAKGGSLHDKLVPGIGLGFEDGCVYIGKQLLAGLGYMHSASEKKLSRVIHRDMKPANILIYHEFTQADRKCTKPATDPKKEVFYKVKIADFGLSKVLNEPGGANRGMTKVGTPAFVAPEVVRQETYDEKADFFSLGCIFFTLYCGEYPFDEEPEYIRNKNASVEFKKDPPCHSWETVSPQAKEVIKGLLVSDPQKRYDLNQCLRHPLFAAFVEPVDSHTAPRGQRTESKSSCERYPKKSERGAGDFSSWCMQGILAALGRSPADENALEGINQAQYFGHVQSIKGWTGSSVDSIEIKLRNGDGLVKHGGDGGEKPQEWELKPDECIIAVSQERMGAGYLGNAIVFFTTKHRTIPILGSKASTKHRFVAPTNFQITGLMFENSRLSGVLIEKSPIVKGSTTGLVKSVTSHQGYAVDQITFVLKDGEERSYGDEGGDTEKTWDLEPNESILIVEQTYRDHVLGTSMNFFTSLGKVHSIRGVSATRSLRYMTSGDDQICGLVFDEESGDIKNVKCCSRTDNGGMRIVKSHPMRGDTRDLSDSQVMAARSSRSVRSPEKS